MASDAATQPHTTCPQSNGLSVEGLQGRGSAGLNAEVLQGGGAKLEICWVSVGSQPGACATPPQQTAHPPRP
eukprot:6347-Chlamydomonas_euryale.AAC.2